ncbi:hypothetical protein [Parasphingorhabdus sp.]|uniref:hypothetical protein n=1 Tax=Parasphingorhabdus sp. TaxID=2709688 RepID=UPI0030018E1E
MTEANESLQAPDYNGLKAVFINRTLTPSPSFSHTECLMTVARDVKIAEIFYFLVHFTSFSNNRAFISSP